MRDAFVRSGRVALGFGDSEICPQCGATWLRPAEETKAVIEGARRRFESLLAHDHRAPTPEGTWTPEGYTMHTGDWLRIWAERLIAVDAHPERPLTPMDQDELAAVRRYDSVGAAEALWALERGAADVLAVADRVGRLEFDHPVWGPAETDSILSWLAHEVDHHAWDVTRGVGVAL